MRVVNSEFLIEIDLAPVKTWQNIQGDVADKVILKTEWQGGDYKIYEWRLGGETGEKISNDYPINKHLTVYAVTNYAKFNLDSTETKIELTSDGKGYTGDKPKGKIIIPDEITEIEGTDYWNRGAFYGCAEITSVQLPQSLTTIGSRAFYDCTGLTSISLPANLTTIGRYAFSYCMGLTSVVFADKEGWKVYDDNPYSGTPTSISSSDLADASKAAKYLREMSSYGGGGYSDKWWKKN